MTGKELYKAVCALGYQTSLEFDENFYTAANIALFSLSRLVPEIKTLTLSNKKGVYDMIELTDDFGGFSPAPIRDLVCGYDYRTEGSSRIVILRDTKRSDLSVEYKRKPVEITLDNLEDEIDIAESYVDMLVLLSAFYVFLDDDPDKAEIFFLRYKEQAGEVIKDRNNALFEKVINVTGW